MIKLDYQTFNPRWGRAGLAYSNWENYAFALGYLANIGHYRNAANRAFYVNPRMPIEVHMERNDDQGAWGKEGRIHYYGRDDDLAVLLPDWDQCKSAGNGNVNWRINSNGYIRSLLNDYRFRSVIIPGYTTADIFPPEGDAYQTVWNCLVVFLQRNQIEDIDSVRNAYDQGWQL